MIKTGSDFSGVGAFDQALIRLGVDYETVYACDMDKYVRQTYLANYAAPKLYAKDVYDVDGNDVDQLDLLMLSPPCQSFSLAGKRKGKDSENGVLFFNSHEFIKKNKPRYFIFENVKGLLSDENGKTFSEWSNMLGGKSINGLPVLFPYEDSVPYHIYHKVLNSKKHGVPQNRERVFIIGIRDDSDNNFTWPKEIPLEKRLKDVLETDVDPKYYLSDKLLKGFVGLDVNGVSRTIRSGGKASATDKHNWDIINEGYINQDTQASQVFSEEGSSPTLSAGTHGYAQGYVKVKSATKKGYEEAKEGDSINYSQPNSETRRGRVGREVAQTLDTNCNQAVFMLGYTRDEKGKVVKRSKQDHANTIHTSSGSGGNTDQFASVNSKIRRLTPRECFRLQDFPDSFTWPVSDSQAYKQAGNSITVSVLYEILKKLTL